MKVIDNLFVYGTLQKGKQHENFLNNLNGIWKKGYVVGQLLNISSGPDYGYPALKLDAKGLKIYGMVFHSKDLESHIKKIDEFELVLHLRWNMVVVARPLPLRCRKSRAWNTRRSEETA